MDTRLSKIDKMQDVDDKQAYLARALFSSLANDDQDLYRAVVTKWAEVRNESVMQVTFAIAQGLDKQARGVTADGWY